MAEHTVDYFPLISGLVLEYQGFTLDEDSATSKFEILSVAHTWPTPRTVAKCRITTSQSDMPYDFEILKSEDPMTRTGIFQGHQLLLPLPLTIGDSWSDGKLRC